MAGICVNISSTPPLFAHYICQPILQKPNGFSKNSIQCFVKAAIYSWKIIHIPKQQRVQKLHCQSFEYNQFGLYSVKAKKSSENCIFNLIKMEFDRGKAYLEFPGETSIPRIPGQKTWIPGSYPFPYIVAYVKANRKLWIYITRQFEYINASLM